MDRFDIIKIVNVINLLHFLNVRYLLDTYKTTNLIKQSASIGNAI